MTGDGAGHPLEVTPMIETTVLLTEDAMARELAAALARHELPEKFFYWFPTSVRAWIDLCSAFLPLLAAAGLETLAHYASDDARFVMALTRAV